MYQFISCQRERLPCHYCLNGQSEVNVVARFRRISDGFEFGIMIPDDLDQYAEENHLFGLNLVTLGHYS